jgi:hypothetical protein
MVTVKHTLTDEQWSFVANDFACGTTHLESALQQKLHFWQKLPWVLCGMACPDAARSRQCAVTCVRLFSLGAAVPEEGHHRLSVRFLAHGENLRRELDSYIAGIPLSDLPSLSTEVAKLAFIPVVERIIEARAGHLRHSLKDHKIKSGKGASLGLRLPELMNDVLCKEDRFDNFLVSRGHFGTRIAFLNPAKTVVRFGSWAARLLE